MDFKAERVSELNCGRCGTRIDPTVPRPLSKTQCPKCGAKVSVPALFGDFLLTDVLGAGAAGIVCKGFDQSLHRQVAIKILRTGDQDAELVEQCTREARALAALNHPHVVQVHSIGEYRGQPFIVMELLDGGDVQSRMIGKANNEIESLDVAIQTAEGLAAAHRAGLVHMDVKPGNILFDPLGRAKLIDFGVAQVARRSTDQVAGTPYYVAPEVIRGKPADFNADIYSLGSTLFHLLAGRPPFEANDATALMKKKLRKAPPNLFEVREDLHPRTAQVVNRMLAADPTDRYASYDELLAELRDAREHADMPLQSRAIHELVTARGPAAVSGGHSPMLAAARTARNDSAAAARPLAPGKIAAVAGAVVLLIAVVVMVVIGTGSSPGHPPSDPATPGPTLPAPPPLTAVIPASQTVGRFANDPGWKPLTLRQAASSGGSTVEVLDDLSVLFTGDDPPSDSYELVGSTDASPIYAIGIEVMPHESLDRGGPGRNDGKFYLSEVIVKAATPGAPDRFFPVELVKPESSYEQDGFEIHHVIDGDPATAWGIAPRFGRAQTATLRLAKPIDRPGAMLRIALEHHPDYKSYIGRVRLWVSTDPRYAPDAPPVAIAPTPDPTPTPAPTPTPPKPPAPEPPKVEPTVADFAPLYDGSIELADEGAWHVLDIVKVASSGGAKVTKQQDGSVLAAGPIVKGDVYTVTALTRLRGVRAIRIDALPDAALPDGGPGRAGQGLFCVSQVALSAGPGADASGAMPVILSEAKSTAVRGNHAARNVLDGKSENGFANPNDGAGKASSLLVQSESPIGDSEQTVLVLTIENRGVQPLGRFLLSAITSEDAKLDAPVTIQRPRSDVEFVAVSPTTTTASRASTFTPQPDRSVLVDTKLFKDNDYTIEFEIGPRPVTALRLEAMADPSLPKSGPGLVSSGIIAIKEITLKAAPKNSPNRQMNVELSDAAVDFAEDRFSGDLAFDGNDATYWAVRKRMGETRIATFRLKPPIAYPGGAVLTLKLSQELAIGRFRISYTTMPDPSPLAARPAPDPDAAPPKADAPPKPGPAPAPLPAERVALFFNLGGPDVKDPQGNTWVAAKPFKQGGSGYTGRIVTETLENGDPLSGTSIVKIETFRATVPNGKYRIVVRVGRSQEAPLHAKRKFTIKVEGAQLPQEFEPAGVQRGQMLDISIPEVPISDGVVDLEFTPSAGSEGAMVSAIAIVPIK